MATNKKIETVKNLTEKVNQAKAMVLADYRGIKHKQLEELRKLLKKSQAQLIVVKNRLLLRALGDKAKDFTGSLNEPSAALFALGDETAPLKELLKFFKTVGFGSVKAGFLADQILSKDDIDRLAKLPARPVLLTQLAATLNAPIQRFHDGLRWNIQKLVFVISAIEEKRLIKN